MSCKLILLEYDWNTWDTSLNGEFPPDPNCNGFTVFNTGAAGTVVSVNGIPLNPGDSFSIGGNLGELFKGRVPIVFTTPGVGQKCTVVQKFYKPDVLAKLLYKENQ